MSKLKPFLITLAILIAMAFIVAGLYYTYNKNVKTKTESPVQSEVQSLETSTKKSSGYYVVKELAGDSYEVGDTVDLTKYNAVNLSIEDKLGYYGTDLHERPLLIDRDGTVIQWNDLVGDIDVGDVAY